MSQRVWRDTCKNIPLCCYFCIYIHIFCFQTHWYHTNHKCVSLVEILLRRQLCIIVTSPLAVQHDVTQGGQGGEG